MGHDKLHSTRCTRYNNVREVLLTEIEIGYGLEDLDQYLRLEVQQLDKFMETTLELLVVEELPLVQSQLESIINKGS